MVESENEILADKAVALTAREVLKYRDIWDVWDLTDRLKTQVDREIVRRKFDDYGVADVEAKAKKRLDELSQNSTLQSFLDEMRRFLPAKRVAEIAQSGLHHTIMTTSADLIRRAIPRHQRSSSGK